MNCSSKQRSNTSGFTAPYYQIVTNSKAQLGAGLCGMSGLISLTGTRHVDSRAAADVFGSVDERWILSLFSVIFVISSASSPLTNDALPYKTRQSRLAHFLCFILRHGDYLICY